jgi:hypothetical protein
MRWETMMGKGKRAGWIIALVGAVVLFGAGCSGGYGNDGGEKTGLAESNIVADSGAWDPQEEADDEWPHYATDISASDAASATDLAWEGEIMSWPASDMAADISGNGYTVNPDGCQPGCDGRQCGPDGCGGSCGWCSAQGSCQEGVCIIVDGCMPECAGKMIGEEDHCGGVCSGGGFGIGLKPGGAQDVGYFRHLLNEGQVPESDFFPIEGFLNEHDTPLPAPDYSMLVTLHAFLGLFYDPQTEEPIIAMQLGLNSGLDPSVIEASPFNLVVVVDTSGSMDVAGKMDFVKEGLVLMLDSLDDNDTLSIVSYDSVARVEMGPTMVTDEDKPFIVEIIENLDPGGSTNLNAGMVQGYELAMKNITDNESIHRVMLLSDGMVTAGEDNLAAILDNSAKYNEEGIGITTIGVGTDFNFDLMYGLANQGNGNFYFLEDGTKLLDVFQHEIEYLLTPVAQNLKISFTLPQGFSVQEIYGFDFIEENGEVILIGPSPQYSVTPDQPDPGTPGGGDNKDVAVSTLLASKKNGLLMVKIKADQPDIFKAWEAMDFAVLTYSYELVTKNKTEVNEVVAQMGTLTYFAEDGPDSPMSYFTGPIMQRNFCVLRAGLAIRSACDLYHQPSPDINGAVVQIADAMTFCNGINVQLKDPVIDEDVELLEQLKDTMCSIMECTIVQ